MKPRFLCAECESELAWGMTKCPTCGKPVDWPQGTVALTEAGGASRETEKCATCGSLNPSDAEFCRSCGAKLKTHEKGTGGKQKRGAGRPSQKSEKRREDKKPRETSGSMFSWKVIFGFLGVLAILVVALELFPSKDQPVEQSTSTSTQAPASNLQLINQINDLEKRVSADPKDMQSLLQLANMCQDARLFDKAIVQYRKYLEKNPRNVDARVDLGICYFEMSNLDDANKEMELALKYDPKHLAAHFNLGIVNLRAGRVKEANEWFRKTIALAPNSEMGQQAKQILEQHSSPLIQNK